SPYRRGVNGLQKAPDELGQVLGVILADEKGLAADRGPIDQFGEGVQMNYPATETAEYLRIESQGRKEDKKRESRGLAPGNPLRLNRKQIF
ncbi:MAG: hypothetical protein LBF58_07860, partial [Deltaproteobacteria bacterium]|nr:hypothetical protein [Deltaproteobacteria bacterium]